MDVTLPDTPLELMALIDAATTRLASNPLSGLDDRSLLELARSQQLVTNKSMTLAATVVQEMCERHAYRLDGYLNPRQFLVDNLHLSSGEVRRRLMQANQLAVHTGLTGERLEPDYRATAAAVTAGTVNADHVDVINKAMVRIPGGITATVRDQAEATLAESAQTLTPEQLTKVAHRLLAHLDPDGTITDDADRRRQRGLSLSQQDQQLMSRLSARLTPALRAKLDVILAAWAAPGMNNPDDDASPHGAVDDPSLDDAVLQAARDRDTRTTDQRNHDALEALCDYLLGHQGLGRPDRLPAEVVITTTLDELESRTGFAVTSTGTALPIADLIRIAAHATPHLAVFANHTSEILYLGRGQRFANKAQRLALFARDRGCTAPGCDRPFSQTQAHHVIDWAAGGRTNIDHLAAACGKHNRAVGERPGQSETHVITTGRNKGRIGWKPAGSRQPLTINPIHHTGQAATPPAGPPPRGEIRIHRSPVETATILKLGLLNTA